MSKPIIYLNPVELKGALGEDTFWTWFDRVFDNTICGVPEKLEPHDVVLHYSVKGAAKHSDQTICLLWELYPEMAVQLNTGVYKRQMASIDQAARSCRGLTTSSELMKGYYEPYGKVDVLPIAVNTELFKPLKDKAALRKKYGIPKKKRVVFWGGNTHTFKGPHLLRSWAAENPDVHIIAVWTYKHFSDQLEGASNFVQVPQQQLVELLNCADQFLCTSLLRPYYMVEWEAMATDLPFIFANDLERDFIPSKSPRDDVFERKWDRESAKGVWENYINEFISNR